MLRRVLGLAAASALAAATLTACSSDSSKDVAAAGSNGAGDGGANASAFPVTIKHAFGETTIEEKPERVATVAWANHEVPLALGVVPVGMAKVTWGDDDHDGVLPWVEDKLTELGAKTPALWNETDGIDYEAIADSQPDVILAAYSGLTKEEYETLSKIAPVVAEPGLAWGTSMDDMIRMDAEALGLKAEGEALVSSLEDQVQTSLAEHPSLEGKKIMFSYIDPKDMSTIGFYTTHDTRPGFLAEHGLPLPAEVVAKSEKSETFYETVSSEEAQKFDDVDVMVGYGDAGADAKTVAGLQQDPLIGKIPAVKKGAVAILQNDTPLAASANPSPLSIPWGIDQYFDLLAAAADKA